MNKKHFITSEYDTHDPKFSINDVVDMISHELHLHVPKWPCGKPCPGPHIRDHIRGLFAYHLEGGARDAFTVDFFWINYTSELYDKPKDLERLLSWQQNQLKQAARNRLQCILDQCRSSVHQIGVAGLGVNLNIRHFEDVNKDHDGFIRPFDYDMNYRFPEMRRQLALHMLQEQLFNDSDLRPEHVFYQRSYSDDTQRFFETQQWKAAIPAAHELAGQWLKPASRPETVHERALGIIELCKKTAQEILKPPYQEYAFTY
jgi:hypothetical protein